MRKNTLYLILMISCVFFVKVRAQQLQETIKNHFIILQQEGKIKYQDTKFKITSEHISSISAIQHIYYSQEINGILVVNTESSLHISSKGEIIKSNDRFIKNSISKLTGGISPSISAIEAIKAISRQMEYNISTPLQVLDLKPELNQKTIISTGGISKEPITATLMYFLTSEKKLVLTWKVDVLESNFEHNWNFYVDATTGIILDKIDNVFYCVNSSEKGGKQKFDYNKNLYNNPMYTKTKNKASSALDCENCYEVFPYPMESPYYGERSIVVNPADPIASPYGWHDYDGSTGAEFFITQGNNITALNTQNYTPSGGLFLNFTGYPFSEIYSEENTFIDASLTNVFYWANVFHDVTYAYGFDENAGNFQKNNYDRGGVDDDYVTISSQDDFNCNAKISVGFDGVKARIVMGTCGNKDADFDNVIVVHEYAHGLTYRLIGGAMSGSCFNGTEPLAEGFSDWYGLMFTLNAADVGETPRGFAKYYLDEGINGAGFRPYPYSTDMEINPLVYQYLSDQSTSTYDWIMGSILWEVTWALIDEFGIDENLYNFTGDIDQDAGNVMAMAIVTESLKLVNCNPIIIDVRDAILTANRVLYGGEVECLLWDAFAKRGLGIGAYVGNTSYETVPLFANLTIEEALCENAGFISNLGGGLPFGGIYSGDGVTDNGDGITFSFNTEIGIGTYAVTYEVPDSFCTIASLAESTIIVEKDLEAPVIFCLEDVYITIETEEDSYSIVDYSTFIFPQDNCGTPSFSQDPLPGTQVGVGEVEIYFEAIDASGNTDSCSFSIFISKVVVEVEVEDNLSIYPNPTNNDLVLASNNNITTLNVQIFDINGREVQSQYYESFGFENSISVKNLASGMYFVRLETKGNVFIKRIIKN